MFIPLVWTLSTSLKSPGEVYLFPPTWIPNEILWSNYPEAVTTIPFFLYLWNTTFITLAQHRRQGHLDHAGGLLLFAPALVGARRHIHRSCSRP